ncbi:hypothetical protein [Clostridium sp. DSM 8431]|nr:hypothetical protein [Clostridium sp. DSM 8431]
MIGRYIVTIVNNFDNSYFVRPAWACTQCRQLSNKRLKKETLD